MCQSQITNSISTHPDPSPANSLNQQLAPLNDTLPVDILLLLVKLAYLRSGKIASRGIRGYDEHYASACGALWTVHGLDYLSRLGYSYQWQQRFADGFEYVGDPYKKVSLSDTSSGWSFGRHVALEIFEWQEQERPFDDSQD